MSNLLKQALQESGYEVTAAMDGREGLTLAPGQDLLIVDVMMPVLSGFEMVKRLRQSGVATPVLFLSARDGTADKVRGLDLEADDYLVKPFKLAELLARIRAVLRRAKPQDVLSHGDLSMDTRARKAKRGNDLLNLSQTEYALLEIFLRHPQTILSKQRLLNEVWNEPGDRDNNIVEVYINYLRGKLEAKDRPRVIHTVRSRGYVLEARED